MSFWGDDFYSPKIARRRFYQRRPGFGRSGFGHRSSFRGGGGSPWGVFFIALLLVLVLLAAIFVIRLAAGTSGSGQTAVVDAVERIDPAIVSVLSQKGGGNGSQPNSIMLGSGVIFDRSGQRALIVTNEHVIDGADKIEIVLGNGDKRTATLIGKDKITDLALLEIDAKGISRIAHFGSSAQLKPGETAIAIGNPLGLGISPTITVGVISSPDRTIPVSLSGSGTPDWEIDVIQTDAAINAGNSGGALVNLDGSVIGINSRKIMESGVEGMGFAIPIDQVKPVLADLRKYGTVKRPYLGIYPEDLQAFASGTDVLLLPKSVKAGVVVVEATGPAKKAGIKSNDVIVALDGKPVNSTLDLRKYLYDSKHIGDSIEVTFYRKSQKQSVSYKLEEMPQGN